MDVLENNVKDDLKEKLKKKKKITIESSIAPKGSAPNWNEVMRWRDNHSSQDKQFA